jgi:23S rRNA (guanine2535-N1)-methyltransferase
MQYKLANKQNYSTFASGKVIKSLPGNPAFPVRLVSEVFQYCLLKSGKKLLFRIYDPCCGSACHFTALAFLHFRNISEIYCSDIDSTILEIAKSNLALLSTSGIQARLLELRSLYERFGKTSHAEAIESAEKLKMALRINIDHSIICRVFQHNILDGTYPAELPRTPMDLVFADVPYGISSKWQGATGSVECIQSLLDSTYPMLSKKSFVAISQIDKAPLNHEKYLQVKKMKMGKRTVRILKTR